MHNKGRISFPLIGNGNHVLKQSTFEHKNRATWLRSKVNNIVRRDKKTFNRYILQKRKKARISLANSPFLVKSVLPAAVSYEICFSL